MTRNLAALREVELVVREMDVGSPNITILEKAIKLILEINGKQSSLTPDFRHETQELKILYMGAESLLISAKRGLYSVARRHMGEVAEIFYENMELIAWEAAGEPARPSIIDALVANQKLRGKPEPTSIPLSEIIKYRSEGYIFEDGVYRRLKKS